MYKLKMLVQHKYNSKYGCKCIRYQGPSLWNRVDNKFKLTAIFNVGPWSVHIILSATCSLKSLKILCASMFLICIFFIFMSENSFWLMFCIALYPTSNKFLLFFLLTISEIIDIISSMESKKSMDIDNLIITAVTVMTEEISIDV